jgi:hypothetical protein
MGHFLKRSWTDWLAILALTVMGLSYAQWTEAQTVDAAMNDFTQAMYRKNPQKVLAAFSQQSPWRYVNFEIGSGKQMGSQMITPNKMSADFQKKTGWYSFFFAEPNGYTFMVLFFEGKPWKKQGSDRFTPPGSDSKTYIKWRQEGGKWVIAEIGETTP